MNIARILQQQAETRKDGAAIIDHGGTSGERRVSFASLEQESARVAGLLQSLGVSPGDHVLVFVGMSAELYTLLSGIFRLGAVAMFLDPSAGRDHMERCCGMIRPKAFVAGWKGHAMKFACGALRRIPVQMIIGSRGAGALWRATSFTRPAAPLFRVNELGDNAPALVTFTSGSTGLPKAAVRTHGFLCAQHRALQESIRLVPGEIDLATLPIFALANLASGVTTVIPAVDLRRVGQVDAALVARAIRQGGATRTAGSPAFLERLADYCLQNHVALETMRHIYTGGAPVFPRVLEKLQQAFPRTAITAVYGSTEAEPIAQLACREISANDSKAMLEGRGLLAGKPESCIRLRILRAQWGTPVAPMSAAEFAHACMAPGEPGEIVVTGEHVLKSYLNGAGDEQTKFRVETDIYHRTGDAGYLDASGRLWLLGRCEACIHDARGTLYPLALETTVLQLNPTVRRVALAAIEGRRRLALEVSPFAPTDLVDQVRRQTAAAGIDEVRIVPQIPVDKRHNAKIDYPALLRLLARGA